MPDSRILSFRGGQAYYRDVPDDPEGLSLTREMMITFREQKTGAQSEIIGQEIKERIIDLKLEQ